MRRLILAEHLWTELQRHARMEYPRECCLFLLGRLADGIAQVQTLLAARNQRTGREAQHAYQVHPRDCLAAEREADRCGEQLLGICHSHPDGFAEPSALDLANANPDQVYLILGFRSEHPGVENPPPFTPGLITAGAFVLREDRTAFRRIALHFGDASGGPRPDATGRRIRTSETSPLVPGSEMTIEKSVLVGNADVLP